MRHALSAHELYRSTAEHIGLSSFDVDALLGEMPADFPILIGDTLPLFAHRFGMIGITLFGRVYLLRRALDYEPIVLLALIRHEAEHVRQQRVDKLFFPRYGWEWLRGFIGGRGPIAARAHAAYRGIRAEVEAYRVGDELAAWAGSRKPGAGLGKGRRDQATEGPRD